MSGVDEKYAKKEQLWNVQRVYGTAVNVLNISQRIEKQSIRSATERACGCVDEDVL